MQNRYKFIGGYDLVGRMFVYEEQMQRFNLSSAAIRDFATAIKKGDLERLTNQFQELEEQQKTGLLNLYIDYNDLWGNYFNIHAAIGYPIDLAKYFGHEHIANFIEEEKIKLTSVNISFKHK